MAGRKRRVPPQDAMFLWGETPDTKMHVASLMPFTPPEDAGPTYLRELMHELRSSPVERPWNLRLTHPHLLQHPMQAWVEDEHFDIEYHVRRSALASPGDERELGILVSRLHSNQIDFTRPPWEMHVIEGLEGVRFATYIKIHHALIDGFTGVKLLSRSLSPDPDDRETPFFFSLSPPRRPASTTQARRNVLDRVTGPLTGVAKGTGAVASMTRHVVGAAVSQEASRYKDKTVVASTSAPKTILNGRTGRNRRLATQQYEISRLQAVAKASGGTLNDVVMAICGGGLRTFLLEQDQLPTKPLIAFMPVNIRAQGDEGGGNMVAATLASMGTDVADPVERLQAVIASTQQAKARMREMDQLSAIAWSGYMLAPQAPQILAAVAGVKNPLPVAFNVCLSNVPGPRRTLYMRGSRLEAVYPMSIPIHGMALNITLESYVDTLNLGFIGCRDAVPHLQKLAVHTGEALEELEKAYARKEAARKAAATRARNRAATKGSGTSTEVTGSGKSGGTKASGGSTGTGTSGTGSR
jgi:diacylglycerol O-acyltransferase